MTIFSSFPLLCWQLVPVFSSVCVTSSGKSLACPYTTTAFCPYGFGAPKILYCNYLYIIPSLYTIAFNANSIEFALALNNILEFEESNGNYKM